MSARIFIQFNAPTVIDPLVVLDAARPADASATLSPGPGIRLRAAGRPSIDIATRANRALLRTRPHPTRDDLALLQGIASAISQRYRGRVVEPAA